MSIPMLNNVDFSGNQLLNAGLQQLSSDPGTPFEGQFWENTTSKKVKAFLNGTVVTILSGSITSADITDGTIVDADISGTAAIAKTKLAALAIVNSDVDPAAAIAESKLSLASDAAAGTPSRRTIGTGATQAMSGATRLDTIASPTGSVGFNSQKITGLADGVAATDAATVGQLNVATMGLDSKASVKAASTANLTLSGAQTIDGVSVIAGDRVLVKDQSTPANNGIYLVAAGAWTRTTDFDSWGEIPGALTAVEQGTVNADGVFLSTADQGGTLNTTAITFSRLNTAPVAGPQKYAVDITGNAVLTQFTVTHSLGTTDVHVQVYDVSQDVMVFTDVKRPTSNTCRIDFAQAPANAKVYRVVVIG